MRANEPTTIDTGRARHCTSSDDTNVHETKTWTIDRVPRSRDFRKRVRVEARTTGQACAGRPSRVDWYNLRD